MNRSRAWKQRQPRWRRRPRRFCAPLRRGPNSAGVSAYRLQPGHSEEGRTMQPGLSNMNRAKQFEPATERGPGFVTASVVDPFGNVLGIMFNRHYLDILGERRGAE